jgi:hypothetical protein
MQALISLTILVVSVAASGASWTLRWADEFDGSTLNTSLWTAAVNDCEEPPKWNQIECYTPSNVAVANGSLWLTARLENTTCGKPAGSYVYNVTSGKVVSMHKANVTFPARIVIRARLQNAWAVGLHSAGWSVGYACDPVTSEIDVYEFEVEPSTNPACVNGTYPNDPSCYIRRTANYHHGESCGKDDNPVGGGSFPSAPLGLNPVNFSAAFRVFSAEVNSTHAMYFDEGEDGNGPVTLVKAFYVGMPGWPGIVLPQWDMYMILSFAYMAMEPGGFHGSGRRAEPPSWVWPATHEIDYVRIYGPSTDAVTHASLAEFKD